jgi:phosphohistidine swiveling domain-containing protein
VEVGPDSIDIKPSPFSGKKVVLTKTRDKDVISFIEKSGGIIEDNMKKDVFMLIVKAAGDKSSKVDYAEKNGIPVVSVDEFKAKYL